MKKCIFTASTRAAGTLGLIASIALASNLHAQDIPVAAPAAAPAKNIWSMFCLSPEQAARCKATICNSPLGEMAKSAAKPMTLMSGGLLFANCGVPTQADLDKLKAEGKEGSAEGVAAAVKKNEAEARARREAVRYLGTVDCNYWPEAKDALINALRLDPNECVRYEAALALLRGCCCNKKIMEHLKNSAAGTDKDSFPKECSWRVRETAAEALAHCTMIYVEISETTIEQKKLKEATSPPQAHGKGLLGIFTSATAVPAATPAPPKAMPPVIKEQTVTYVAPAPQYYVTPQPEKKKLFGRIDWPSLQKETKSPEVITMSAEVPAAPAVAPTPQYYVAPQPEKKKLFGRIDWPSLQKETKSPEVITTSVEAPVAPAWTPPVQSAPVPFSTATSTNTYNPPAVQYNRPPQEPAASNRGVVMIDVNGQ